MQQETIVCGILDEIKKVCPIYDCTETHAGIIKLWGTHLFASQYRENPNMPVTMKDRSNIRYDKGLFITGKPGAGKTQIATSIASWSAANFPKHQMRCISAIALVAKCKAAGNLSPLDSYRYGNVCLSDVGSEHQVVNIYGTIYNIIQEFVKVRIDAQATLLYKSLLYIESNITIAEFIERYEDDKGRIASRFYALFNDVQLEFKKDTKDYRRYATKQK